MKKVLFGLSILAVFLFIMGCTQQTDEKIQLTDESGNLVGEAFKYGPMQYQLPSVFIKKDQCLLTSTCQTIGGEYLMVGEGQILSNIRGFVPELKVNITSQNMARFTICGMHESFLEGEELPENGCQEFTLKLCQTKKVAEDNLQLVKIIGNSALLMLH